MNSFNQTKIKNVHDDSIGLYGPIVYHYTSPNAFLNIIRSKTIRFTDIRYMNDHSERVFFIKLLIDFFESNHEKYPHCENAFWDLIKENNLDDIKSLKAHDVKLSFWKHHPDMKAHTFILCTSEAKDSLGMWNYYVNGNSYQGYNIGIDISKFIKIFENMPLVKSDSITVNYGEIIYNRYNQLDSIDNHLNIVEKNIEEIILQGVSSIGETEYCHYREMLNYINTFSCFFKDESFSDEREYRIMLQIHGDIEENDKIDLDFVVKNGLIVPFINIQIPNDSVKEISISPITEADITKSSIEELLKRNNFKNVSITQSCIPVRF